MTNETHNYIQMQAEALKWCSICIKGPNVGQENIPNIITSPAAAWAVDGRQVGAMDLWC